MLYCVHQKPRMTGPMQIIPAFAWQSLPQVEPSLNCSLLHLSLSSLSWDGFGALLWVFGVSMLTTSSILSWRILNWRAFNYKCVLQLAHTCPNYVKPQSMVGVLLGRVSLITSCTQWEGWWTAAFTTIFSQQFSHSILPLPCKLFPK